MWTRCYPDGPSRFEVHACGLAVSKGQSKLRVPEHILDQPGRALLVWATTPWTLTSNVAAAVHPGLTYALVRQGKEEHYLEEGTLRVLRGTYTVVDRLPGERLVGLRYDGPFDDLPAQRGIENKVIPWKEVSAAEGTGIVHIVQEESMLHGSLDESGLARCVACIGSSILLCCARQHPQSRGTSVFNACSGGRAATASR